VCALPPHPLLLSAVHRGVPDTAQDSTAALPAGWPVVPASSKTTSKLLDVLLGCCNVYDVRANRTYDGVGADLTRSTRPVRALAPVWAGSVPERVGGCVGDAHTCQQW
jgi:hypothetical protein